MRAEIEAVLELQPSWVAAAPNDDMQLRGLYIRRDIADFVRARVDEIASRLLCAPGDIEVEGKDSTGYYSRVPWVRFANRQLSPDPRTGWYAVYLFSEDGHAAFLCLIQGTQEWDGAGMRSRPLRLISQRSDWARSALEAATVDWSYLETMITLGSASKSRAYEAGTVCAFRYEQGNIPDDGILAQDLLDMATFLQEIYRAEAMTPAPGDLAPEIAEAERLAQQLAGRRVPSRAGFRTSPQQRRAIELRAMGLATAFFENLGGEVKDVSATRPFDLTVKINGEQLSVEVKGTVGDGSEVLLTRGEVKHHGDIYPQNALVVVSGIRLHGPTDAPLATDGDLHVVQPWLVEHVALTPVSYRYAVPVPAAS